MSRSLTGWSFVAAQAVLLCAVVLLPERNDWPTPGWVSVVGFAVLVGGLGLVGFAALGLGSALTPTPVPRESGQLMTEGLYSYVRHPIYTGVLLAVIGVTLRSGSWITLAVAAVTFVFFNSKAAWEEARLTERYADYPGYAASTPRFVPRVGRS